MASKIGEQTSKGRYLVIGAGYAGLAVAIELRRKGFKVEVIEAVKELTTQGDIIQLGSNATRVMSKWGPVLANVKKDSAQPPSMTIFDTAGRELLTAPLPEEFDGYPVLFSNRGLIQRHIYDYAVSIGVEFRFGCRVSTYFEGHSDGEAAGVIVNGDKIIADGVIACDGIHSLARGYVTGKEQKAPTSGFAIYRTWFSLDLLADNPLTKKFAESDEDGFYVWVGTDTHVIVFTSVAVRGCVLFCTHKDDNKLEQLESWSSPGQLEDMLKVVEGWDPVIKAVMEKTPKDKLIDWKLLWRDPIRKWQSTNGRIILAGDSAHPHLPTSGSGAAQAIEDAATIATVLDVFGREKTTLAFTVFEKLRFERTSLTQRMGWETRHRWHQVDWEAIKTKPELLKMPQPYWLYCFDAEEYAHENAANAAAHVEGGQEFRNTNVPKGHVHEDWTVEMMMALESKQVEEHFYRVANR